MIKEIKYNGYTSTPSDYECPDGDLEGVLNLIPEDGSMHAVIPPKELMKFGANEKVMFVHKTSAYTHYIVYNGTNLYWMNSNAQPSDKALIKAVSGLQSLNAVGNTLLALTDGGIRYFLWKNTSYLDLGDHIPNIELSFGLNGNPKFYSTAEGMATADEKASHGGNFTIDFDSNDFSTGMTFSDSGKAKATSAIMSRVNKMLAAYSVNKGRFSLPFFVRYALRLYDGSLVGHSAPILMNPATTDGPLVLAFDTNAANESPTMADVEYNIMLMSCKLDYMLVADSENDYQQILDGGNWNDIVKSIDVFITPPIYTYDQGGNVERAETITGLYKNKFIGSIRPINALSTNSGGTINRAEDVMVGPIKARSGSGDYINVNLENSGGLTILKSKYLEWEYMDLFKMYYDTSSNRGTNLITPWRYNVPLPLKKTSESGYSDIDNASNFYKLCSIDVNSLTASVRKDIDVPESYLQSLVNREVMTDDYLSHDRLIATFSHAYNSRINLAGLKRGLFRGFYPESMLAYCDATKATITGTSGNGQTEVLNITIPDNDSSVITIDTYIKENGSTYKVTSTGVKPLRYFGGMWSWGSYLFYPNVNATKMVIKSGNGNVTVDLKPHEFLNGAYAVLDYETSRSTPSGSTLPTVTDTTNKAGIQNKIYTSEVNNPFYFPLSGINTVGTGEVMAITSVTKALSQGQFGQFPLYAFCSDGVWAMQLNNAGLYNAVQPVTRDVCTNPKSITQTDSAVLFATDRGIMMLEGANTACLSDVIDKRTGKSLTEMTSGAAILSAMGFTAQQTNHVPLREFLEGCRMIYDYTNQRIIVYNPSKRYAYVFSLRDKAWGMMASNFSDTVNAYPAAYAMATDGGLLDVSDAGTAAQQPFKGMFWTRPFKLDYPDALKTIDTIIQRGTFKTGHVQQALYGSRNLFDWSLIISSANEYMRGFRGTPFKYFKLCVLCNFDTGESIHGCTVQYEPRFTNQPR